MPGIGGALKIIAVGAFFALLMHCVETFYSLRLQRLLRRMSQGTTP
jgi:hypothetical protein